MANNAPKIAAKERREPMAAVDKKAVILVSQIKSSRHFIAFTGAGVSTSAGKCTSPKRKCLQTSFDDTAR